MALDGSEPSKINLTINDGPVEAGDTLSVSYTKGTVVCARGAFLESFTGETVTNNIISGAYSVSVVASSTLPVAGVNNEMTVTVYKSDDSVDTGFTGDKNVTISGYLVAPVGSTGTFSSTELTDTSTQVEINFDEGVGTADLALHKAGIQNISFEVEGLKTPASDPVELKVSTGPVASMVSDPASLTEIAQGEGQAFTLTLTDTYGNLIPGETVEFALTGNQETGTAFTASSGVSDASGEVSAKLAVGDDEPISNKITLTFTHQGTSTSISFTDVVVVSSVRATSVTLDGPKLLLNDNSAILGTFTATLDEKVAGAQVKFFISGFDEADIASVSVGTIGQLIDSSEGVMVVTDEEGISELKITFKENLEKAGSLKAAIFVTDPFVSESDESVQTFQLDTKPAPETFALKWDGGETFNPTSSYYHYHGSGGNNIKFQVKNLGSYVTQVSADFSAIGGDSVAGSIEQGLASFDFDWASDGVDQSTGIYTIPVEMTVDGISYPLSDYTLININPFDMGLGLDGDTTDWSLLAENFDFTFAENLVFEKEGLGKIEFSNPINLCEATTVAGLSDLGDNLNIDLADVSINTASDALAGFDVSSTISMYNLSFKGDPSVYYYPNQGEKILVVDAGELTAENDGRLDSVSWQDNTLTLVANSWSRYRAFDSVPNMIDNWAFEGEWQGASGAGNPEGWVWGKRGEMSTEPNEILIGNYSFAHEPYSSYEYLEQLNKVMTAGTTYNLSIWVKGKGTVRPGIADGAEVKYITGQKIETETWIRIDHSYTSTLSTTTGGVRIGFQNHTAPGERLVVGAVWLSEQEPPTDWPLIINPINSGFIFSTPYDAGSQSVELKVRVKGVDELGLGTYAPEDFSLKVDGQDLGFDDEKVSDFSYTGDGVYSVVLKLDEDFTSYTLTSLKVKGVEIDEGPFTATTPPFARALGFSFEQHLEQSSDGITHFSSTMEGVGVSDLNPEDYVIKYSHVDYPDEEFELNYEGDAFWSQDLEDYPNVEITYPPYEEGAVKFTAYTESFGNEIEEGSLDWTGPELSWPTWPEISPKNVASSWSEKSGEKILNVDLGFKEVSWNEMKWDEGFVPFDSEIVLELINEADEEIIEDLPVDSTGFDFESPLLAGFYQMTLSFSGTQFYDVKKGEGCLAGYTEVLNTGARTNLAILVRAIPSADKSSITGFSTSQVATVGFDFIVNLKDVRDNPITGLDEEDFVLSISQGTGEITLLNVEETSELGEYKITVIYDKAEENIQIALEVMGVGIGTTDEISFSAYIQPALESAETDTLGNQITLTFNKEIEGRENIHEYFSYKIAGDETVYDFTSSNFDFINLVLTKTNGFKYGDEITLFYDAGETEPLRATDNGTLIESFADFLATNKVVGKANYLEVSASTTTPLAGADNQLTIEVYKSDDSLDTDFTGNYIISISGYTPAPDGSFGKINESTIDEAASTELNLAFNSGVATLNLVLNNAEEQTIVIEIGDVLKSTPDESLKITPKHGAEKELRIITQPQLGMREGTEDVAFSVHPVLELYDEFGNFANTSDIQVVAEVEGVDTWWLNGTVNLIPVNGQVTFAQLTAKAKSDEDVIGAQIKFTAGTLSVTSEKFNFVGLSAPVQTAPEHGSHENSPGLALTWDEVDGAEKYLIQIAEDSSFSDSEPVEVSATSYDVSDMGEGQYFWRVRSSKTVDEVEILSSWSPTWEFTIDDTPPKNVSLTIKSMTKDNKVTFNIAAEDLYTEDSDIDFTLEQSLTEDFDDIGKETFHGTGDHTLHLLSCPNIQFYGRVFATDDAGNESGYSQAVSTVTYANAPAQVQAEANMQTMELELSWNPSNNPSGTQYLIKILDNETGDTIKEKVTSGSPAEAGRFTYSASGIEKGKTYAYGIASLNSLGMESDFVHAHTTIPDWPVFTGPIFNLPKENTYITSPETTTFSWTPVENHDSVQYYEIQFADDKEFKVNPNEMSVGTGTSSDFFSGNEEQAWYLRIRAVYNELEQSDWSDALGDVFIYSVSTTPPTMDSLEDSAERHSITLTAEISEGLAPFREDPYRYEVSTHSDFSLIEEDSDWIAASDYTFNELLTGATYYYKVSARDISGHILESTGSISTDAIALEVSTEIEQVETVAGGKITFTLPPVSLGVYAEVLAPTASDLAKISAANAKLTDENYSVDIVAPRDYHFLDGRGRPVAPADFDDSTDKISIRMEYSKDYDAQEASALRIARLNTATSEWEILPESKTNHNPKEKWVEASLDSLSIYALVMAPLSVDVKEVYVYPNPFKPGDATFGALGGSGIVIAGLPEGARVRVFTIAGELVEEFTTSVGGDYRWAMAEDLASGVYIMAVTYDGDSKTLKFAVVK